MDTPDLEKVIQGLEHHVGIGFCDGCPYGYECDTDDEVAMRLLDDALALLKVLEPRGMTLEEALGADACWIEAKGRDDATLAALYVPDYWFEEPLEDRESHVYYMGTDLFDTQLLCEYGKTWRCWTRKPSKEQREAAKWDG